MKILVTNTAKRKYGGKVYERMAAEVLSKSFKVKIKNLSSKKSKFLWELYKLSREGYVDVVIRNFDASLFLNQKPVKNIAIVHHIDYSFGSKLLKFTSPFFTKIIFHNLKKFDAVVTVSQYWKNYFRRKGYENIYLIYNGFDMDEFKFSPEEIEQFKKNHNLLGKPIIYLGNCQKAKGVFESYQALKDLDAHLVTSGESSIKTPAQNLEINHFDYLRLLKASSVVLTMSKFKEGWCRTAHEAMLLKTPVIGSGKGGMRELLNGGGQIICEDFGSLREKVEYLLTHLDEREKMGEAGFNFAKNFTIERFKSDWTQLINKII